MKKTYLFSGIFQTDRPLTNNEIAAMRHAVCAQIEDPVSEEGESLDAKVDLGSITIIPFNDKVEIIVNPEMEDSK